MNTPDTSYGGHVFMQRVSGSGPYFGHYRFAAEGSEAATPAWVDLPKSWPTRQLASDDATRAAHFAIDARNYGHASNRAVAAAARVMLLDSKAIGWADAVAAQLTAAAERNTLEAKLLGARELHWPDILIHGTSAESLRCR